MPARILPHGEILRGGAVDPALQCRARATHLTVRRGDRGTTHAPSNVTDLRFFSPAQAHVAGSARYALVATITPSQNAKTPSSGMGLQMPPGGAKDGWSRQADFRSASIGRSQEGVRPSVTQIGTGVPDAENPIMVLRAALERRRCSPLTPYDRKEWAGQLVSSGLEGRYPHLLQGLAEGFDLGIPCIERTYTPPNHPSLRSLFDVYSKSIESEFTAGRYIGPFSRSDLEQAIGPFQSSPLSFVPKTSKPGVFRAVHNFSHPHTPSLNASSINSHIISDDFPCTWGTFSTVALIISRLPAGSQASIRDVAEAYRTIPVRPSQWPGLVVRLQADDQYAVNVCNNFGLSSAGGAYGMLADAGADFFRARGMGPLAKWVDDHIFFRIPRSHLPSYNAKRSEWHREILASGGRRQEGGRVWFGGKGLPSGEAEEFDEDCSEELRDLSQASLRAAGDQDFTYADADIDELSACLGIRWQTSKTIPFGTEVPYLGFRWDMRTQLVHLPDEKKVKYLAAIADWQSKRTHNLLETQQLHGKLLHAALVIPAGRAHLTNLEAMLASFNSSPFLPHTPPRDTPHDLAWWQRQLGRANLFIPIPRPHPLVEYRAYSDASSGFGVAITVGERWRAWRLVPGWKSQGRDIQWAEAIGFELLTICVYSLSGRGDHIVVYGDNRGVVKGWWKRCSANRPTNHVFRRILQLSEDRDRSVHTRYVPSADNPADAPSRGRYPPRSQLLDPITVPDAARPLLIDI